MLCSQIGSIFLENVMFLVVQGQDGCVWTWKWQTSDKSDPSLSLHRKKQIVNDLQRSGKLL